MEKYLFTYFILAGVQKDTHAQHAVAFLLPYAVQSIPFLLVWVVYYTHECLLLACFHTQVTHTRL